MVYRVWGGRFQEGLDLVVHRFNASISFDKALYKEDIEGSKAHVKMLEKQGILKSHEAETLLVELDRIRDEIADGRLLPDLEYEDIHSFVEAVLTRRLGELGKKLHTARSRNDQVALDLRLYLRRKTEEVLEALKGLMEALVGKSEEYMGHVMPGYTHLQRAQPVLVSHHLMAYYFMFKRDYDRFVSTQERINRNPLGSGALAGTGLPIDRHFVSELLDMGPPLPNSMDGVSDRDFAIEFLSNAAISMMHLSRLSEELVLWSSKEFGFIELKEGFCTGSSLMPQKKNPDVPELIRGKTGRIYGNLISLLVTMKGLPLCYNKDMQEDKEPVFDTSENLIECLKLMRLIVESMKFHTDRLKRAAEEGDLTATDLVEYLVLKGVSFREAHELVGRLVLMANQEGLELSGLSLERFREVSPLIDEGVYEWLDPVRSVEKKLSYGGTAPERVKEQIQIAKEELARC